MVAWVLESDVTCIYGGFEKAKGAVRRATYFGLAYTLIHIVKPESAQPHRIESAIVHKDIDLVDQGVQRASAKLVRFDEILAEVVWPYFRLKASDDSKVVASASHGPP